MLSSSVRVCSPGGRADGGADAPGCGADAPGGGLLGGWPTGAEYKSTARLNAVSCPASGTPESSTACHASFSTFATSTAADLLSARHDHGTSAAVRIDLDTPCAGCG